VGRLCGSSKQPHPGSQTYVGLLVPTHIMLYGTNRMLKMSKNLQFKLGHQP